MMLVLTGNKQDCKHAEVEYFYVSFNAAGRESRHYYQICKICGLRLSNPWCPKPPDDVAAAAKPSPKHSPEQKGLFDE